ncbi:MAG: hypothetical protein KC649_02060, partial [Candidatus Omnitrophica bacterium]|nr:hypothetical protein [Candidatus Omnitrophota bacterium]
MKNQADKTADTAFDPVKSGLIIFFAVLCLYFSFDLFADPHAASRRYRMLTYPIFTAICLAWVFHTAVFLIRKAQAIRVWRSGIILCVLTSLLLSAGIFRISPQKLRIFDDAPDRISTSIAFSKFHRCERLHAGFWQPDGSLTDTASSRTARSPFFAYLVSVIHSFTGYRIENIFLANWIVLNAILIIASLSMLFFFGKTAAICTQLLILSQPLVLYVTESACYEGVGAVALMVLLCASYRIISQGPGQHSASFLMLAAAAGIHCRPEMIALIALVFLITAVFSKSWLFTRASAISGITLFLSVMPYIWHRISFKWTYPTMNIKGSGGLGVAAPTVSKYTDGFIQSFIKSFSLSAESFFKISDVSAFNGLLNYIFLIAVLFCMLILFTGRMKIPRQTLMAVFSPAACIISYVLLISIIGWSADHPNTARYFIFLPIA